MLSERTPRGGGEVVTADSGQISGFSIQSQTRNNQKPLAPQKSLHLVATVGWGFCPFSGSTWGVGSKVECAGGGEGDAVQVQRRNFTLPYLISLEKAMAPHSGTLAWRIPWMEEPGRLQSMGSLRVGHD